MFLFSFSGCNIIEDPKSIKDLRFFYIETVYVSNIYNQYGEIKYKNTALADSSINPSMKMLRIYFSTKYDLSFGEGHMPAYSGYFNFGEHASVASGYENIFDFRISIYQADGLKGRASLPDSLRRQTDPNLHYYYCYVTVSRTRPLPIMEYGDGRPQIVPGPDHKPYDLRRDPRTFSVQFEYTPPWSLWPATTNTLVIPASEVARALAAAPPD